MGKTPLFFAIVLLAVAVSAIFLKEFLFENQPSVQNITKQKIEKENNFSLSIFEEYEQVDKNYSNVAFEIKKYIEQTKEKQELQQVETPSVKLAKKVYIKKPKLAIIMDDVGFEGQVRDIKKIPFAITPSFFPPNGRYPNTPYLAKKFKHYMIHFPMEANNFQKEEENTLLVSNSQKEIAHKIRELRDDFPKTILINNHTGSKFTSDFEAMDKLFYAMGIYNFKFLDSRTSIDTKGSEVGKLYDQKVLERNIFLDNEPNVEYIKNQLKLAVDYAKKHGIAIAICHPRVETFKALMNSQSILKSVELIYVSELL